MSDLWLGVDRAENGGAESRALLCHVGEAFRQSQLPSGLAAVAPSAACSSMKPTMGHMLDAKTRSVTKASLGAMRLLASVRARRGRRRLAAYRATLQCV
jgi:hypothetical protein